MHVTDEMVEAACRAYGKDALRYRDAFLDAARSSMSAALEAALRAAPAAEPVAWLLTSETTGNVVLWTHDQYRAASEELKRGCKFTPLYTAPPAPAADEWMPIETAPKDGTVVLIAHTDAVFAGWWERVISTVTGDAGWVDGVTDSHGNLLVYNPTHWRPIPTAPTEAGR